MFPSTSNRYKLGIVLTHFLRVVLIDFLPTSIAWGHGGGGSGIDWGWTEIEFPRREVEGKPAKLLVQTASLEINTSMGRVTGRCGHCDELFPAMGNG